MSERAREKRRRYRRFSLRLHPLFFLVGIAYALTGRLLLFALSCLVALQHECAHAFAAAKRGYELRTIVLTPYGAAIVGNLDGLSVRDEAIVAAAGPFCNLCTAAFFGALWWFVPTTYAFTDTAFYASLAVALVNALPAYPLDGGRILRAALYRGYVKTRSPRSAAKRAQAVCRWTTTAFAAVFVGTFVWTLVRGEGNLSLLTMAAFLLFGAWSGSRDGGYARIDFSFTDDFRRGATVRRVAIGAERPIKDALPFISRGEYLVLEVYDGQGRQLFTLPQNELSAWFLTAHSPYATLGELYDEKQKRAKK